MPLKSMKELSQPLTLTIPEDSPIYKALMESTKQKKDEEHKVACLEADLEETTNILNAEISDLKIEVETWKDTSDKWNEDYHKLLKEHEKLKEEVKSRKSLCDHFEMLNKKNYEEKEKLKGELYEAEQEAEGFRNEYPKLKEENEKLKKENKKIKRANEINAELHDTNEKVIEEQIKENEKLKEELKKRGNVVVANSAEEL